MTCAGPAGATRLLWIDDEVRQEDPLLHLLAAEGVTVELAASGADGLAKAQSGQYDVVLVDLRLPDMFGLTVVRRLAGHLTARLFVASGYYLEPEIETEALRLGAGFLRKPFLGPEDLIAPLADEVRRPAANPPAASVQRRTAAEIPCESVDAVCSRLANCTSKREQAAITLHVLLDRRVPLPLFTGYAAGLRVLATSPSCLPQPGLTIGKAIRDAAAHPLPANSKLLAALSEMERSGVKQEERSLAKRVGLSRPYFARLLLAQTGRRYHDWMRFAVMRAVLGAVLEKSEQTSQIAFRCGYETLSHLDHDFAKTFGVAPRQLRQLYLECHLPGCRQLASGC